VGEWGDQCDSGDEKEVKRMRRWETGEAVASIHRQGGWGEMEKRKAEIRKN